MIDIIQHDVQVSLEILSRIFYNLTVAKYGFIYLILHGLHLLKLLSFLHSKNYIGPSRARKNQTSSPSNFSVPKFIKSRNIIDDAMSFDTRNLRYKNSCNYIHKKHYKHDEGFHKKDTVNH